MSTISTRPFLPATARTIFCLPVSKAREAEYSLLRKIDDLDAVLTDYWDKHEKHIKSWYATAKRPDDIIASATPRFLMEPIVARLRLTGLVATDMDPRTGKINGEFAAGPYKVDEFKKQFRLDEIDEFYSDAYSDHFLAEYAKKAFVVHGDDDERTEWNEYFSTHKKSNAQQEIPEDALYPPGFPVYFVKTAKLTLTIYSLSGIILAISIKTASIKQDKPDKGEQM